MERQGCENTQRGKYINSCLGNNNILHSIHTFHMYLFVVKGGHTEGNRVTKDGYESCLDSWEGKHKKCVDNIIKRFPTFNQIDPNGRCKANGINKSKRQSHELSQWDIWALNAAYDGPLPQCQHPGELHNPWRQINAGPDVILMMALFSIRALSG